MINFRWVSVSIPRIDKQITDFLSSYGIRISQRAGLDQAEKTQNLFNLMIREVGSSQSYEMIHGLYDILKSVRPELGRFDSKTQKIYQEAILAIERKLPHGAGLEAPTVETSAGKKNSSEKKLDKLEPLIEPLRDAGLCSKDINHVLDDLKNIDRESLPQFHAMIQSLHNLGVSSSGIIHILSVLKNASQHKLGQLLDMVNLFQRKGYDPRNVINLLDCLKGVPEENLERLLFFAISLQKTRMEDLDIIQVLISLKDVSVSGLKQILSIIQPLDEEGLMSWQTASILKNLKRNSEESLKKIVILMGVLKGVECTGDEIFRILMDLEDASEKRVGTLADLVVLLDRIGWEGEDIVDFLVLLKDLPEERLDKILGAIFLLREKGLIFPGIHEFIDALAKAPEIDVEKFLKMMELFKIAEFLKEKIMNIILDFYEPSFMRIQKFSSMIPLLKEAELGERQIRNIFSGLHEASDVRVDKVVAAIGPLKRSGFKKTADVVLLFGAGLPLEFLDEFFYRAVLLKQAGMTEDHVTTILLNFSDGITEKLLPILPLLPEVGLKGEEVYNVFDALKEDPNGNIEMLFNVITFCQKEGVKDEWIRELILNLDLSKESLETLFESLQSCKEGPQRSFEINALISIYINGIESVQDELQGKTAGEILAVVKLVGIDRTPKGLLQKLFTSLSLSESLEFIEKSDLQVLRNLLPKPQLASIRETSLYYLCANKANDVVQKAICLRILKQQVISVSGEYQGIEEVLKELPTSVKNTLAKEILVKGRDLALLDTAKVLLTSKDPSSFEQKQLLIKCEAWEERVLEFSRAISRTNLSEEKTLPVQELLAELTLRQEVNYKEELLVAIINEIKHIPAQKMSKALIDIIPSPESSFEEIAKALHPCHVLEVVNGLRPSHSSLDPSFFDLKQIFQHLESLEDSFDKEAVAEYLNEVLWVCRGEREIFEKACLLAKRDKIPLEERVIEPAMMYLLPLCKTEEELLTTLMLAVDHEEDVPSKILEQVVGTLSSPGLQDFIEQARPKILQKVVDPFEITSIPSAVLRVIVAEKIGNSALKQEGVSYLEKNSEKFLDNQECLGLLPALERQELAKYIFLFSDSREMLIIGYGLLQGKDGILPPVPMWLQELEWIDEATTDPAGRRILKELSLRHMDIPYDPEELNSLAENALSLPENLRERILAEIYIPPSGVGKEVINASFDVVSILHILISDKENEELFDEFLDQLFLGKPNEQDAVRHLVNPDFLTADIEEACSEIVGIILKERGRLETVQREQLDIDYRGSLLSSEEKTEIVKKLSSQSDLVILESLKTIATEEESIRIDERATKTQKLDRIIERLDLPSTENSIILKNLIIDHLINYENYDEKSLKEICEDLLTVPKEVRSHVLRTPISKHRDKRKKVLKPSSILLSLPPDSELFPIYLDSLSLNKWRPVIQELLEKAKIASNISARATYETAIFIIMYNNQSLRAGVNTLLRTPLFSKKDLAYIGELTSSTQDSLLESVKNINRDFASTIRKRLLFFAKARPGLSQYGPWDARALKDEGHPIEFIEQVEKILNYQAINGSKINHDIFFANITGLSFSSLENIILILDSYDTLSDQQILSIVSNGKALEEQLAMAEVLGQLQQDPLLQQYVPTVNINAVGLFIKAIKELLPIEEIANITIEKIIKTLEDKVFPELYLDPQAIEELNLEDIEKGVLPPKLEEARRIFQEIRTTPLGGSSQYILDILENIQDRKNCYRIYASIKAAQKLDIPATTDLIASAFVWTRPYFSGLGFDYNGSEKVTSVTLQNLYGTLRSHIQGKEGLQDILSIIDPERVFYPLLSTSEEVFQKLSDIIDEIPKEMTPDLQAILHSVENQSSIVPEGELLSAQDRSYLRVLSQLRSEDVEFSYNIEGFREKVRASSISVKDLPETVSSDTPLILFKALKDKILQFDSDVQGKVKIKLLKVLEQGGQVFYDSDYTIVTLLDQLIIRFKDNDYSDNLMHRVPKNPDALIDQDTYRLYVIFDYIQKLSSEPAGQDVLSEQDDYLILTLANIQQCSTGQSEGIAQVYALTQDNILSLQAQESGEKFIDKFIQDTMIGTLKTKGFDNHQQVHQDLYLKNMLFDWIGLKHSLTFDRYSNLLSNVLINQDKQELLKVFYRIFPDPLELCQNLREHIDGLLSKAYPMIAPLLDHNPMYWDEEGRISMHGCVVLLEHLGYLNITNRVVRE